MKKALLIIDVQMAFLDSEWGNRNNPGAEGNIKSLLSEWRKRKFEVIFIQHTSKNPLSCFHSVNEGYQINRIVTPHETEKIFTKEVNSAFIGTSLEYYLNSLGIKEVVITGLTTPHCVSTTARMSGNLGFETYLISDATAAFALTDHKGKYVDAQTVHDVSLAAIHNEFATVLTTKDFLENHLNY
jgi:nicotinamidase-related amidase